MNYQNDEILQHYGVRGMKWGVRKAKASSKTSNKKTSNKKTSNKDQSKASRKRNIERAVKMIGTSALLTVAVSALLNSKSSEHIQSGKQVVNSYMKKNGEEKISDYEKSWADYAWEEVQKSGWG